MMDSSSMMDTSASSEELEMTLGSTGVASVDQDSSFEVSFEGSPGPSCSKPKKAHSPFALRSQCANSQCCPHGKGILFRSRISPSPARKTRLRSRRRRRSDQSRLDVTDSTSTTLGSTLLDVSNVDCSPLKHAEEQQYLKGGPRDITVSLGHTLHHHRDDEALRRSLTPKKKKKEVWYEDQQGFSRLLTSNNDQDFSRLFASNKDEEFNRLLASHKDQEFNRLLASNKEQESNRLLASNITNITSLSHSQETSQVDFRMNENSHIGSGINSVFIAPTDTVVSSTPTKAKPSTVTDSSESGFEEGVSDKTVKSSTSERFFPGSQFFSQFRTPPNQGYSSTSDYFTDFTGTDTPSKLRESTRRLSIRKPFNPYIAYSSDEELDEWMKNPKTDYTYSESLTYRKRVTPERKVGSPNMSRKGLRGNIDYNKSSDFSDHSFSLETNSYGKSYQKRSSGVSMDVLSDSESESPPVATRTRASRSTSIDHRPNSNGSIITTVTKSNYTTTRKTFELGGGLDVDSDDEGKVPLPSLRFRTGTPLITGSRTGTPLARRSTPLFNSNQNETHTRHYTTTLTPTPEEEEKTLYKKIVGVPGAACRTVATSSKWVFSSIVTSVILMATRTATYLSSSRSSSTASADKLTSIADSNSSHITSTKSDYAFDRFSTKSDSAFDRFSTKSDSAFDRFSTKSESAFSSANSESAFDRFSTKSESAFDRFMTTVTTVITTITTTTTTEEISDSASGSLESVTTKVKRRPRLLFWIPLLLLLLLLAYWWLFLAPATSDDVGETQSLGYLLSLPFIKLYDLSSWLALSAYDSLLLAATKIYDLTLWLTLSTYNRIVWLASSSPEALITASSNTFNTLTSVLSTAFNSTSKSVIAFRDNAYIYSSETISDLWLGTQNIFSYLWLSSLSILNWCWSLILICLAYLLDLFYYIYGTLQIIGLSLYGVLLSSASVFSTSPLSLASSNDTLTEAPDTLGIESETDSTLWLSVAGVTHSTSEMIIETSRGLKRVALTSQDWIWSAWVWIIASVGETVSNASGYTFSAVNSVSSSGLGFFDNFLSLTSWGFLSLWSLLVYLWSGLWSGLAYLLTSLWTFFTSFTFTVAEFATGTAAVLTNTVKLISIPTIGYFATSSVNEAATSSVNEATSSVITPTLDPNTAAAPRVTLENMVEEIVEKVLDSSRLQDKLQQLIDTHNKEEDMSALVRSVIEQEVNLVRAETTVLKKEVAIISSDSDQILGLKEQQAALVKQLDMLAAAVENTSENAEKQQQFNDQLSGLRDQINILSQQLLNLQDAHANLESEVSTCCKRASLTLADVERHVTTLLGDIFGFSVGDNNTTGESGEKPSMATASDLNAWLKSYFVAKHELEARLTALADSMEKAAPINVDLPKETMEQTTQMVMETVMDKIRGEIRLQYEQLSSQSKETLSEQVKEHVKEQLEGNLKVQVEAEVGKLKEQIALDVQEQVKDSKEELGTSLNAEVISIIAESVSREISAAVPMAVSSAVPDAVASHVNGVVEKVIDEAVESSVKTVVSKEIASALPETVNAAVDEKISSTLPDVVAVSLPDMVNVAVNTTIKETVMKAADIAVAAAVVSLPQLNMGGKNKETIAGDVEDINTSGRITANISLSQSNGNSSSFGVLTASGLNEKDVQRIVKEALTMYDADKTGMVDHALESAGGNIISTRCTEGYQVHQAEVSILGWPIYRYSINNPRTLIQPDVMPGQCWAFKGSQGYIVIQLAGHVRPTGFTMEHIPKSLSPSGSIDSAPREFSVWGLESENGEEVELGNYEFLHDGEPLQYFSVKEGTIPDNMYFPIVELKIKSNHGNMKYTCLYRFRVHGVRYF